MKNFTLIFCIAFFCFATISCKKHLPNDCNYENPTQEISWLKDHITKFEAVAGRAACAGKFTSDIKSAVSNDKTIFVVNEVGCGSPIQTEIYACDGTLLCDRNKNCDSYLGNLTYINQIYSYPH